MLGLFWRGQRRGATGPGRAPDWASQSKNRATHDVPAYNHQLLHLTLGIAYDAGGGFQNQPMSILVTDPVLQSLAYAGAPCLFGCGLHFRYIIRMNLLVGGSRSQLS